jgi:hypothetical protein
MGTGRSKGSRGWPIPHDNATVELDSFDGNYFHVYCGNCTRRQFDIRNQGQKHSGIPFYKVEKSCPHCKRLVDRPVTAVRGTPIGSGGRWACECGGFLATVDAIRGRLTLQCRCGHEVRVTVHGAVELAYLLGYTPTQRSAGVTSADDQSNACA